jgi:hypothetical protein
MTETVRGGPVPFLLRGFLRLLVLTTPLLVVFSIADADERRVTWLDTHTSFDAEPAAAFGSPRAGTQVQGEGHVRYVVDHASVGLWLVTLLPALVLALAVSAVALCLLRTMRETYAGRPFSSSGVQRLRLVALVIAVAAVAAPALGSVSAYAITRRVLPDMAAGPLDQWDVVGATVPWLVVSLLVLCVTEAFGIGARLAADVDGLV